MTRNSKDGFPSLRYENEARLSGYVCIAGVDEAGRGPLAGPVVAAAVVLPCQDIDLSEIRDSKLLSPPKRQRLYEDIIKKASTGIGIVEPAVIDKVNILQASRRAMVNAVRQLNPTPDYLIIDGPISLDVPLAQQPIIGGDKLCMSVAAASIVAKVTRDTLMQELHIEYPQYGFDRNKGYPTGEHRRAILTYGPCPAHRNSFRGVKEFLS